MKTSRSLQVGDLVLRSPFIGRQGSVTTMIYQIENTSNGGEYKICARVFYVEDDGGQVRSYTTVKSLYHFDSAGDFWTREAVIDITGNIIRQK